MGRSSQGYFIGELNTSQIFEIVLPNLIHKLGSRSRHDTIKDMKTEKGFAYIFIIGISALITLGGILLTKTHKPGNPPFSFVKQDITEEPSVQKNIQKNKPDTASTPKMKNKNPIKSETKAAGPKKNCVSNINPQFTHAFTDLSKIDALNPIGGIGGGSPGRSYIGIKEGMEAPVYAPVDATLRKIIYANRGAGYGEYGLIFVVSCELEYMFDHLDKLSDTLLKYAPKTAAATSQIQDNTELDILVKAGELLGYTDGTDLAHTFDFLVTNYAKRAAYINPKRWEWEQAIYSQCPYDYFAAELRAAYYAKLGKPSYRGFIKADSCGNPSHDVAGTASGGWFKDTSTDKRGEYLAIAKDYNYAQVAYRKDGQAFESSQAVQMGKPYLNIEDDTPEKYPEDIKPGQSICYGNNNEWAFIKLLSETELSFAAGNGSCPSVFPESQASVWIR